MNPRIEKHHGFLKIFTIIFFCIAALLIHVENVHITAPYARVIQDSTVFNFSDLLLRFVPQDSAKKDTAAVDNLTLTEADRQMISIANNTRKWPEGIHSRV